jgi:hypothetical protein
MMTTISNFNTRIVMKFYTTRKCRKRERYKYQEIWFLSTPLFADDKIIMSDTWEAAQ